MKNENINVVILSGFATHVLMRYTQNKRLYLTLALRQRDYLTEKKKFTSKGYCYFRCNSFDESMWQANRVKDGDYITIQGKLVGLNRKDKDPTNVILIERMYIHGFRAEEERDIGDGYPQAPLRAEIEEAEG